MDSDGKKGISETKKTNNRSTIGVLVFSENGVGLAPEKLMEISGSDRNIGPSDGEKKKKSPSTWIAAAKEA